MSEKEKEINLKINVPPHLHCGVYANSMFVAHSKEEFIIDFIVNSPTGNVVTSRVIVTPAHLKRIIDALQDNFSKYESQHGKIEIFDIPSGGKIFH